jgi:hypothetical protein
MYGNNKYPERAALLVKGVNIGWDMATSRFDLIRLLHLGWEVHNEG